MNNPACYDMLFAQPIAYAVFLYHLLCKNPNIEARDKWWEFFGYEQKKEKMDFDVMIAMPKRENGKCFDFKGFPALKLDDNHYIKLNALYFDKDNMSKNPQLSSGEAENEKTCTEEY